jgi:hypothetical protein
MKNVKKGRNEKLKKKNIVDVLVDNWTSNVERV